MRGAKALASYTKQVITEYAGNPLIEALPPILDETAAAELISNFPQPVTPEELELDGATRIHCIDRLRTVAAVSAAFGTRVPVISADPPRICWP